MGYNPIAWNAIKDRRKEEKQRRAIAEARKQAEKFGTENLTKLPSQADFPMQKNEWGEEVQNYWKRERVFIIEGFNRAPGAKGTQLYQLC